MAKKSPQKRNPPVKVGLSPIQEAQYDVYFADTMNVAMRPDMVAFTFYSNIPDPFQDQKRTIRRVQTVVQTPLNVAIQIPSLIVKQILSVAEIPVDDLKLMQDELKALHEAISKKIADGKRK